MVQNSPIRLSKPIKWLMVLLVGYLAVTLLGAVTHILLPFIWAIIVAYIFNPLITLLTRRTNVRRGIWVMALYIVMLGLLALLITALVPIIASQYEGLRQDIPHFIDEMAGFVSEKDVIELPAGLEIDLRKIEDETIKVVTGLATALPASVPNLLVSIIEGFIHFLVFLVSTFYLLLHAERISSSFYNLIPEQYRGEIKALVHSIDHVLGAYIRGQLILIGIMSAASFVVLTIFEVRYALIIAIATGVLEIIPFVGPYLATSIAALVALLQGGPGAFGLEPWVVSLIVIICYFALRQFEDHVIIPALIGHIVDLHPVIVLFAILAGGVLGGALGLLIAIPIAAVIKILLVYLYRKLIDAPVPGSGPLDDEPALVEAELNMADNPTAPVPAATTAEPKRGKDRGARGEELATP